MKNEKQYGVFYVNSITNEKVEFQHAMPVNFNREQAEQFIKDITLDRWLGGGTPLTEYWSMKAIPLD